MSDTNNTETPAEQKLSDQDKSAVGELFRELGEDAALIKKIASEAKTVGWKAALANNAAAIVAEAKDDIEPVKNALPAIKAGYKTSEFWMIAGLGLANVVAVSIGKPIPFDVNVVLGVLTGIYTIIRGIVKK